VLGRWILGTVVGVAVVAAAAYVVLRWAPAVPDSAASSPVAHAVLAQGAGSECLPRRESEAGYMDVCWEAHRYAADDDPEKDYYLLRVYSTFGRGSSSGGPRWAVLKAALEGQPAEGVFEAWPSGEFDGTCEPEPVTVMGLEPGTAETLCGHIAASDSDGWTRSVTWTCQACLLPDGRDWALSLYEWVGVAQGSVPSWQVFADFGD
jgi:hypothetical protein